MKAIRQKIHHMEVNAVGSDVIFFPRKMAGSKDDSVTV